MIAHVRVNRGATDCQRVRIPRITWRDMANRAFAGIIGAIEIGSGSWRWLCRIYRPKRESQQDTSDHGEDRSAKTAKQLPPA